MKNYRQITPGQFSENPFSLIGDEWMLVTVQKSDGSFNCMTASWGGFGVLWNKNVCFVFIRPSRYTYEFSEAAGCMTLSFFGEEYRSVLNFCGAKSGRDVDKVKECGLSAESDGKYVSFGEARMTVYVKKLYAAPFEEKYFTDKAVRVVAGEKSNLHTMYICEIEKIEKDI